MNKRKILATILALCVILINNQPAEAAIKAPYINFVEYDPAIHGDLKIDTPDIPGKSMTNILGTYSLNEGIDRICYRNDRMKFFHRENEATYSTSYYFIYELGSTTPIMTASPPREIYTYVFFDGGYEKLEVGKTYVYEDRTFFNESNNGKRVINLFNTTKDTTPPVIATTQTTGWTAGNVELDITVPTASIGVASLTLNNSPITEGAHTVSANGVYTIRATDYLGNLATKNITVNNIDKTSPAITCTLN